MILRIATERDFDQIVAIDPIATGDEARQKIIRAWLENEYATVVIIDHRVVGYVVLEYTFYSQGFISMLVVQKDHRRLGIATSLIKKIEEICKTEKLFTSTNQSNVAMKGLMSSISYEPSGIVYNLDDGDPEIIYFKRLKKNR